MAGLRPAGTTLKLAGLGGVHLAEFFELHAQPVAERAFGSQFVEKVFGFVEILERKILRLEQIAEASLNLIFGKQGSLLPPVTDLGGHVTGTTNQQVRELTPQTQF